MPYLNALEVSSRQGAIQIHVYLTLPIITVFFLFNIIGALHIYRDADDL